MSHAIPKLAALVGVVGGLTVAVLPRPALAIDINDTMELRGYLDLEYYLYTIGDEKFENSFQQHFANIMFKARPMPGVFMLMNVEFVYGGYVDPSQVDDEIIKVPTHEGLVTGDEHGHESGYHAPSVSLHGAFLEVDIAKNLKLRAGQFATPFGHFNDVHDVTPVYYSVGIPSAVYMPTDLTANEEQEEEVGPAVPRFNTGLSLIWDPGPVKLTAFLGNGYSSYEGFTPFDDNNNKGVGLRIETDPINPITGYITAYTAKIHEEEEHEEARQPGEEEGEDEPTTGVCLGGLANFGDFQLVLEGYGRKHGDDVFNLGGFGEVDFHGIKYMVPFLRYEMLEPNIKEDGFNPNSLLVVGTRIELAPGRVFLKLEHDFKTLKDGDEVEREGEFKAAIVGWF